MGLGAEPSFPPSNEAAFWAFCVRWLLSCCLSGPSWLWSLPPPPALFFARDSLQLFSHPLCGCRGIHPHSRGRRRILGHHWSRSGGAPSSCWISCKECRAWKVLVWPGKNVDSGGALCTVYLCLMDPEALLLLGEFNTHQWTSWIPVFKKWGRGRPCRTAQSCVKECIVGCRILASASEFLGHGFFVHGAAALCLGLFIT